jgi:hypothetical protein
LAKVEDPISGILRRARAQKQAGEVEITVIRELGTLSLASRLEMLRRLILAYETISADQDFAARKPEPQTFTGTMLGQPVKITVPDPCSPYCESQHPTKVSAYDPGIGYRCTLTKGHLGHHINGGLTW